MIWTLLLSQSDLVEVRLVPLRISPVSDPFVELHVAFVVTKLLVISANPLSFNPVP